MSEGSSFDTPIAATPALADFIQESLLLQTFDIAITGSVLRIDQIRRSVIDEIVLTPERWPDNAGQEWKLIQEALEGKTQDEEIFRGYNQLLQHLLLARSVDSFLAYISDLLLLVFKSNPQTLKSESNRVKLELILEHQSMEDLVSTITDRRVTSLSFKSMSDLTDYLDEKLSFDLFEDEEQLERAVRIIEARNIIVHNRGRVSRLFKERLPDHPAATGDFLRLEPEDVQNDTQFLFESAVYTDDRATNKFGLEKVSLNEAPGILVEHIANAEAIHDFEKALRAEGKSVETPEEAYSAKEENISFGEDGKVRFDP